MDRIATSASYQSVLANLMRAESRQADAQSQVSTGKKANDLKGFGRSAEAITAARTLKTRIDGQIENAGRLAAKLAAQDLAMGQVESAAGDARAAIANAVASGRGDGLMAALGSYFSQAIQGLNTQHNGQYLFGGGENDTPPVSANNLADLSAAPSAAAVFDNGPLVPAHSLDDSTTLKTGFLANSLGGDLFDAFRQMQAFADGPSGPFGSTLTPTQEAFLTGMLQTFDAARSGATEKVALNGLNQNRVDQTRAAQEDRQLMLESLIGDLSEVDIAEAASRLAQAQTAVQASAQVFATLRDTSLLDYLR